MAEYEVPTTHPQSCGNRLGVSKSQETIRELETIQSGIYISATTNELTEELESERSRADELQEARNRIKECESNEQMFSKRVKDLEQQVNLLRCLAYGEEKEMKERGRPIQS